MITIFSGAWNCVKYLVSERSDEINQCYDENFPIHQATLHDIKFLGSLVWGYSANANDLTSRCRASDPMRRHDDGADLDAADDGAARAAAAGEEVRRGHAADAEAADGPRAAGPHQRARQSRQHAAPRAHREVIF